MTIVSEGMRWRDVANNVTKKTAQIKVSVSPSFGLTPLIEFWS